jgi:hypothetical protein
VCGKKRLRFAVSASAADWSPSVTTAIDLNGLRIVLPIFRLNQLLLLPMETSQPPMH